MRWPLLAGKARTQPASGHWDSWKQVIADDCEGRCIYCGIPEARFGGVRNFHVEHFRPKVKFPALEDAIRNLYLACAICNVLKCDDWPAEPAADHSIASYPDPALTDFNMLLRTSATTHEVEADTLAARYMIERLVLNRAQLVLERRLFGVLHFLKEFEDWIGRRLDDLTPAELRSTLIVLREISGLKSTVFEARPYRDDDTKRRPKPKARSRRSK